jgi:hypothetical protein
MLLNAFLKLPVSFEFMHLFKENKSLTGIFHCSSPEVMTKFDVCMCMAKELALDASHLIPDSEKPKEPVATRPYDAHLVNNLEENGIHVEFCRFNDWFRAHSREI